MKDSAHIVDVRAGAYSVPTMTPECDGTLCWDATELVLVQLSAAGVTGLGYSYTQAQPAASLVRDKLAACLLGEDAFDLPRLWQRMNAALRNLGRPGLGMMALAAVDIALWDLKARLLEVPLWRLWGGGECRVPAYGSGGFTDYDDDRLQSQLAQWARDGLRHVEMKVGSRPQDDARRVQLAREAVGSDAALMVDANGAYDRVQASQLAQAFAETGVCWFEEPVSSDDLDGLHWLRDRMPPGMALAAGEYGWDVAYYRRMLDAGAVDVLQADATRCGYSGFLKTAALCEAYRMPLSAHCAPALHAPLAAAVPWLRHVEYFHDHARLESMLFDGVPMLREGALWPVDGHGHGLQLKSEAAAYEL